MEDAEWVDDSTTLSAAGAAGAAGASSATAFGEGSANRETGRMWDDPVRARVVDEASGHVVDQLEDGTQAAGAERDGAGDDEGKALL
eukprot:2508076-Prymnesium_polylepis.1